MKSAEIIQRAAADGVILTLSPSGGLKLKGKREVIRRWIPTFKAHKPELLRLLDEAIPPAVEDLREFYEERAAILEHDGGLPPEIAETEARKATATLARNRGYPWRALREALGDPAIPDLLTPVDALPFGVPRWTVDPSGKNVLYLCS